jgi:GDP-L-fucose synthase
MIRILITGGNGMVGKHLQELIPNGMFISSKDGDLTSNEYVQWIMSSYTPDIVVHLAAKVGGIKDNINNPVDYINDNILINTNVLKYSHKYGVKRFIGMLSTCAYPDVVSNYPMKEEDLLLGSPSKSNIGYGYSKRCLSLQIDAYNQQYDTCYNYIIPCNLYSEYDNFENENKMHFITSLLYKIKNTKDNQINLFGDGTPLRQFMYAGDLARIIKRTIDENITDSFNIAYPENMSIDEMAKRTLNALGKPYQIAYSNPNLNGQIRKDVSIEKFKTIFPDFQFTSFEEGVRKVYDKINQQ